MWLDPLPALGLLPRQAGPSLPRGVRGEVVDELPAYLIRGLPELKVLWGDSASRVRPSLSHNPLGPEDPVCSRAVIHSSWIAELPTSLPCPPPSSYGLAGSQGRLPLGAGQAGLRPAVPGGRKPRQWALVPCPQAQGQHLRLSASSLPTLSAPQGLVTGEAGPGSSREPCSTDATPRE